MDIFNGVELSDEQKAAVQSNLDKEIDGRFVNKEEFEKVLKNRDDILAEKKAVQERERKITEEAEEARIAAAAKNGDIDSLNKSWQEKFDAIQGQLTQKEQAEKNNEIQGIAREFVSANVVNDPLVRSAMTDAISRRIDIRDGKQVVLDTEGNVTALNTDDLFNEIKSASVYKPHLVATKASGGGASGSGTTNSTGGAKSLADANSKAERLAVLNERLAGRN